VTQLKNRIVEGQALSSTPQACALAHWISLMARRIDIIRAEGARRVGLFGEVEAELSGGVNAVQFITEVLKVFRGRFEQQDFLDYRREVRQ
jgi:hypothetical protein